MNAPEDPDDDPLLGVVLASRYRIDRLLGVGGMGSVYLAQHVKLQKPMAVKILHKDMSTVAEVVARFEREAIAAARIDHPHVVAANDFGTLEDGSFFLVLEYTAGRSLQAVIDEGPLPTQRALHIALQVAEALSAAHEAKIIHRDLKPDNVMLVERSGDHDFVKVLDFGIAKVTLEDTRNAPQLTRMGAVFGTPQYMAPEQAAGKPVDPRADMYGAGVLLFEMLDGKPPFDGPDPVGVVQMQLRERPRDLPSNVDPRVVALVSKLLEKKPDDRVQTAHDLIERIRPLLERSEPSKPIPSRANAPAKLLGAVPSSAAPVSKSAPTVLLPQRDDAEPIATALVRRVKVGPLEADLWLVVVGVLTAAVGAMFLLLFVILLLALS